MALEVTFTAASTAGHVLLGLIGLLVTAVVAVQLFFIVELWWRTGKGLAAKVLWTFVLLVAGWFGLFVYLMAGRGGKKRPPGS